MHRAGLDWSGNDGRGDYGLVWRALRRFRGGYQGELLARSVPANGGWFVACMQTGVTREPVLFRPGLDFGDWKCDFCTGVASNREVECRKCLAWRCIDDGWLNFARCVCCGRCGQVPVARSLPVCWAAVRGSS
jgi:hypothetical protein